MSSYTAQFMTPEYLPAVQQFLARNFAADEPQNRPGWLQWQIDNPDGGRVLLIMSGSTIAALSFFLPVTFHDNSGQLSAAFSVSTMVDPDHRRKGLGKTIHAARLDNYHFALSSGQSPENHRLYMKLGFNVLGTYRFMLVVKRLPPPRLTKLYAHELLSRLKFTFRRRRIKAILRVALSDTVPPDLPISFFEERMMREFVKSPIHTPDYLRWRYQEHPYFQYQFACVYSGGTPVGLGVFRRQGKQIILVDLYCHHTDLIAVIQFLASSLDADQLYCRFVGNWLNDRFRRAGCYTHIHGSTYLGNSAQDAYKDVLSSADWCLFMGDSDEDR